MPIVKLEKWQKLIDANDDPYGKMCVNVARRVMEILDEEEGDFDLYGLIHRAGKEVDASLHIKGFMLGTVATIVSIVHSRGDESKIKMMDPEILSYVFHEVKNHLF